jgi:hypothetical protein
MKSLRSLALATLAAGALTGAASAGTTVVYSNGGPSRVTGMYQIQTFDVADTFTAAVGSVINGATFTTWGFSSDSPTAIDWAIIVAPIGANPTGVTPFASGTASITATTFGFNGTSYTYDDAISFADVTLPSVPSGDTYWFMLSNGKSQINSGMWWDVVTNGAGSPSNAWWTAAGSETNGNTFTLTDTTAPTPEPAAWALMLAGFAGLGGALRSRRRFASL